MSKVKLWDGAIGSFCSIFFEKCSIVQLDVFTRHHKRNFRLFRPGLPGALITALYLSPWLKKFIFNRGGASSLRVLVVLLVARFLKVRMDRKTILVGLWRLERWCAESFFWVASASIFRSTLLMFCFTKLLQENLTKVSLFGGVLGEGRDGLDKLGIHLLSLVQNNFPLIHVGFDGVAKRFNLMSTKTCDVSE